MSFIPQHQPAIEVDIFFILEFPGPFIVIDTWKIEVGCFQGGKGLIPEWNSCLNDALDHFIERFVHFWMEVVDIGCNSVHVTQSDLDLDD